MFLTHTVAGKTEAFLVYGVRHLVARRVMKQDLPLLRKENKNTFSKALDYKLDAKHEVASHHNFKL
jgi:hypothetical protein